VVLSATVPLPEKELIQRIRARAKSRARGSVRLGIGDDCALLHPRPGQELLVTTDFTLEGTHFRGEWHSPESVGHRCLCRGLSDIAAMGGEPLAAFLSLALPADVPQKWVDGFLNGFLALARGSKTVLAGGDTSQSRHGILADVMVVGEVPAGGCITRRGARAGDVVYVTGALGGSAVVLRLMFSGEHVSATSKAEHKHFFPEPCLAVGKYLRERGLATAMIDISDGLSSEILHICKEIELGCVIYEEKIPVAEEMRNAAYKFKLDPTACALSGGEDYELLFTLSQNDYDKITLNENISVIGYMTEAAEGASLITKGGNKHAITAQGWNHIK